MAIKPIEGVHSLERSLGAEGSGIIEDVGSALNQDMKGKKVAFCWGAWSQFVIRDFSEVIVFNNKDLEAKTIARAYVNPMTALCLKEKIERLSEQMVGKNMKALVCYLGAESSLGITFMNLC